VIFLYNIIINYLPKETVRWGDELIFAPPRNFLGRVVEKILRKLGWVKLNFYVTYERVKIPSRKLSKLILDVYEEYLKMGKRPTKVILGQEQMNSLEIEYNQMVPTSFYLDVYNCDIKEIYGMQVELNPLIDGVVMTNFEE